MKKGPDQETKEKKESKEKTRPMHGYPGKTDTALVIKLA
jgi:hypothetical protein